MRISKSNKAALSRHFCFLPRKGCYAVSPVKHRKILPPPYGSAARFCLAFLRRKITEMKFKRQQTISRSKLPKILRRFRRSPDPILVLKLALFNYTDGWNRVFSKEQYARFSV